jgi:hypothetical protein
MFSDDFSVAATDSRHETVDAEGHLTENWDDADGYYRTFHHLLYPLPPLSSPHHPPPSPSTFALSSPPQCPCLSLPPSPVPL